jgi:hypothetical protein
MRFQNPLVLRTSTTGYAGKSRECRHAFPSGTLAPAETRDCQDRNLGGLDLERRETIAPNRPYQGAPRQCEAQGLPRVKNRSRPISGDQRPILHGITHWKLLDGNSGAVFLSFAPA